MATSKTNYYTTDPYGARTKREWLNMYGIEGNCSNEIIRYCCTLIWGESIFFLHWGVVSITDQISKFHEVFPAAVELVMMRFVKKTAQLHRHSPG